MYFHERPWHSAKITHILVTQSRAAVRSATRVRRYSHEANTSTSPSVPPTTSARSMTHTSNTGARTPKWCTTCHARGATWREREREATKPTRATVEDDGKGLEQKKMEDRRRVCEEWRCKRERIESETNETEARRRAFCISCHTDWTVRLFTWSSAKCGGGGSGSSSARRIRAGSGSRSASSSAATAASASSASCAAWQ